jgi:hypothetical protein
VLGLTLLEIEDETELETELETLTLGLLETELLTLGLLLGLTEDDGDEPAIRSGLTTLVRL